MATVQEDFAHIFPCHVLANTELEPWALHIGELESNLTPMTTYWAQCVQGDFRETITNVAFPAEQYAIIRE